MLTRDMILSAADRKPVPVNVPEWGGQVFVRTMSGVELIAYQERFVGKDDQSEAAMVGLIASTTCDESGNLLFSMDDVPQLSKRNSVALLRIFFETRKLNPAISDAELEKLAGKSEAVPA